jgi:glycosyltransferase involved in cell wall biosynthesis
MIHNVRVGFLTSTNPRDRSASSGVHYRMFQALKQEFEHVVPLGPLSIDKSVSIRLRLLDYWHRLVFRKSFNKYHSTLLSKYYARQFEKKLAIAKVDIIFAPKSSTEIAYLNTNIPICYESDTSFSQLSSYYESYAKFSSASIKESNLVEQKAVDNSVIQVYPSEWAANHVIDFYNANPENVIILKHAANIEIAPSLEDIRMRSFDEPSNLLFVGFDWERKGGDVAFETFKILLEQGHDVSLTICGCVPPVSHPKMRVIPSLNKNNPRERAELNKLFLESHIFFMPVRAECFGIALCEANAFGLPIVTTATGGVVEVVENGKNGYALPMVAKPIDYANTLRFLLDNPNELKAMSLKARQKYDKELNWGVWGKGMRDILLRILKIENPQKVSKVSMAFLLPLVETVPQLLFL